MEIDLNKKYKIEFGFSNGHTYTTWVTNLQMHNGDNSITFDYVTCPMVVVGKPDYVVVIEEKE